MVAPVSVSAERSRKKEFSDLSTTILVDYERRQRRYAGLFVEQRQWTGE